MSATMRLLAIVIMFATPALARAERTFALVMGINDYRYVGTLDGARADAEDISAALTRSGATRVFTLLDQDVTKANVVSAWQAMLAEAQPGDLLFVSYAGHGAQVPERVAGDEADHMDEFWVLPGFDPQHVRETWRETIFDNELNQWFTEAARRGLRVVLVADSCHAGGMDRSVSGKLRFVELGKKRILGELLAAIVQSGSGGAPDIQQSKLPDGVTLLAATPEALPVPEVVIDGRPRGALSWSVARALEGKADRDGNGVVSRAELEDYIYATVRIRSEALQTPVFTPTTARSADETLLWVGHAEQQEQQVENQPSGQSAQQPQPMARDLGFKPVLPLLVQGSTFKPENIVGGEHPYVWDASKGVFKTPNGDIAAEDISAYTVNDVVEKFILLDFLKAMASSNPGRVELSPQKQVYLAGDRIKFEMLRAAYKNMVVFNLANTGEVQFVDMVVNGEPSRSTPLREMQVVAPFGSDHLVAIASNQPLEAIGHALERGASPKDVLTMLTGRIDGTDTAVAIIPIYTRAR